MYAATEFCVADTAERTELSNSAAFGLAFAALDVGEEKVLVTWDTGAWRCCMAERFGEILRDSNATKDAVKRRYECSPIHCEGIVRQDSSEAPMTINHASEVRLSLRLIIIFRGCTPG